MRAFIEDQKHDAILVTISEFQYRNRSTRL